MADLMIPRFKVIADYPQSPFHINDIYYYNVVDCELYNRSNSPAFYELRNIEKWPNIFKPLQWWEERKKNELPDYVKTFNNRVCGTGIIKLFKETGHDTMYIHTDGYCYGIQFKDCEPATEFEYLEYKKNH